MESGLVLLFAAMLVFMAPGARGSSHLTFANNSQVNITRTGCGVSKVCMEKPTRCDPAGNGSCLFASGAASVQAPDRVSLLVELRGNSMGYVGVGFTLNASQGVTALFVCAQNASANGTFFFRTMLVNNTNGQLGPTELPVTMIRGVVSGDIIKCDFEVPALNVSASRSTSATTFAVLLGTGTITGNTLGSFNVSLSSGLLDLSTPSATTTTTAAPTTAPMGGADLLQSHALLLLLLVGVATAMTSSLRV